MKILAINWVSAFDVVFFGFGMVLLILVILVLILTLYGKLLAPKVRVPKQPKESKNHTNKKEEEAEFLEQHLPAEYSAAIAMALHLYYSDEHDVESQIITIKTVQRRYSPWSSKIYGLNNLVK